MSRKKARIISEPNPRPNVHPGRPIAIPWPRPPKKPKK